MAEKLPLEVNDPIQVKIGGSESSTVFESRVQELAADELLIHWPVDAGDRIPIRDQQLLIISFVRNQAFCEFEAIVRDRIDDPMALLAIHPVSTLRSIQRRQDVRVRVPAPVELTAKVVRLANFRLADNEIRRIRTETLTLSAGGFSIHYHSPVIPGTLFEVRLSLPGERRQALSLSARVVRCAAVGPSGPEPILFELGFAFTRITEAARTRIVRFVFSTQREGRKED